MSNLAANAAMITEAALLCGSNIHPDSAEDIARLMPDLTDLPADGWSCEDFRGGLLFSVGGANVVFMDADGVVARA